MSNKKQNSPFYEGGITNTTQFYHGTPPTDFLNYISAVPPAVPVSEYIDSWDYISKQEVLRPLERGCNQHILSRKILSRRSKKSTHLSTALVIS